jgi:hypothetical protein
MPLGLGAPLAGAFFSGSGSPTGLPPFARSAASAGAPLGRPQRGLRTLHGHKIEASPCLARKGCNVLTFLVDLVTPKSLHD